MYFMKIFTSELQNQTFKGKVNKNVHIVLQKASVAT